MGHHVKGIGEIPGPEDNKGKPEQEKGKGNPQPPVKDRDGDPIASRSIPSLEDASVKLRKDDIEAIERPP